LRQAAPLPGRRRTSAPWPARRPVSSGCPHAAAGLQRVSSASSARASGAFVRFHITDGRPPIDLHRDTVSGRDGAERSVPLQSSQAFPIRPSVGGGTMMRTPLVCLFPLIALAARAHAEVPRLPRDDLLLYRGPDGKPRKVTTVED